MAHQWLHCARSLQRYRISRNHAHRISERADRTTAAISGSVLTTASWKSRQVDGCPVLAREPNRDVQDQQSVCAILPILDVQDHPLKIDLR